MGPSQTVQDGILITGFNFHISPLPQPDQNNHNIIRGHSCTRTLVAANHISSYLLTLDLTNARSTYLAHHPSFFFTLTPLTTFTREGTPAGPNYPSSVGKGH